MRRTSSHSDASTQRSKTEIRDHRTCWLHRYFAAGVNNTDQLRELGLDTKHARAGGKLPCANYANEPP